MTMQFQKKDPRATISTPFGEIRIRFYPDDAPRHVENFINLAKMPRDGNSTRDFNDNGSQFFISLQDNGGLDRRYSIFGEIIRGIEVIDMIAKMPRDERDNPLEPIRMKVTVKE